MMVSKSSLSEGSSPRVRSRRKEVSRAGLGDGIISACAEQTEYGGASSREDGDHLRVCGADSATAITNMITTGSSPRVRSRRPCNCATTCNPGIISACAEQTILSPIRLEPIGDHLRVCGADSVEGSVNASLLGSSPRVRSRLHVVGYVGDCIRDHLRVCGADFDMHQSDAFPQGSSPRVRSRLVTAESDIGVSGIISACAEQTDRARVPCFPAGDHLRVCGADYILGGDADVDRGSSPRVRSRLHQRRRHKPAPRIISACAEQTGHPDHCSDSGRDHLRVCGADRNTDELFAHHHGSSPRVRSRQRYRLRAAAHRGIISACAEQTSHQRIPELRARDHLRVCGADGQR